MKKVLIVGENSYIGESFAKYVKDRFEINTLDAQGLNPVAEQFGGYDVVFYVAGIAHRKETKKNAHLYYEVNRNLAVETAMAAKKGGVGQFIILSSMSVYGLTTGFITKDTKANPNNHYGKSKLQADEKIWRLRSEHFRVAILRPPMVYGNGCKGNYQPLRKLALMAPIFPEVDNQRSMIYIGNLCSFVQDVIDQQREGIFFPQNSEYVNTSEMVEQIAVSNGKRIRRTKCFNPLIKVVPLKTFEKVFGSLTYEKTETVDAYSFEESIKLTEKGVKEKMNANNSDRQINLWIFHHYASTPDRNGYIRPFRFAKHLEASDIKTVVFASSYHHWADIDVIDDGSFYKIETADGVPFVFIKTPSSATGSLARVKNMASFAVGLEKNAKRVEKELGRPDIILASSPHPLTMIAGIRVAKKYGIPCICEIRDLWPEAIFAGTRIKEKSLIGKLLLKGEHWIYKKADALIFTMEGGIDYLHEQRWLEEQGGAIKRNKCFYINNGVDLKLYEELIETGAIQDEDLDNDSFKVIYAGAIRPVNNVENIIDAAKLLREEKDILFLIYGDGNLKEGLETRVIEEHLDNVKFKGYVDKVHIPYILSKASVNLLNYSNQNYNWTRGSSSNKLFDYMASGRPIISTIKVKYSIIEKFQCGTETGSDNPEILAEEILKYFHMSLDQRKKIGQNAKKGVRDFDYTTLSKQLLDVIKTVLWAK